MQYLEEVRDAFEELCKHREDTMKRLIDEFKKYSLDDIKYYTHDEPDFKCCSTIGTDTNNVNYYLSNREKKFKEKLKKIEEKIMIDERMLCPNCKKKLNIQELDDRDKLGYSYPQEGYICKTCDDLIKYLPCVKCKSPMNIHGNSEDVAYCIIDYCGLPSCRECAHFWSPDNSFVLNHDKDGYICDYCYYDDTPRHMFGY